MITENVSILTNAQPDPILVMLMLNVLTCMARLLAFVTMDSKEMVKLVQKALQYLLLSS